MKDRDDVEDWRGDLVGESETERDTVVDRVRVPLGETLDDFVPEGDREGEPDTLGEPEKVFDTEELGHTVAERLGDKVADGLRDWEVEAV